MVKEISEWFRLGFDYTNHKCTGNMMSAGKHPQVIEEYLNNEISLGRVVDVESLPVQISRFGVIPKGHQRGKWRQYWICHTWRTGA